MVQKIFASPCAVQSSKLFTLNDDILINEIFWRVDLLAIQRFRATCQGALPVVDKIWKCSNFWKKCLITYYPYHVQNTWKNINEAVNPRLSFKIILDLHDLFVLLAEYAESNLLSGIIRQCPFFINSKNWANNDNTPLMELINTSLKEHAPRRFFASNHSCKLATKLLEMLKHGTDINLANAFGYTPLHLAAQGNLITIGELLMKNGAQIEATTFDNNSTPLLLACRSDASEVAAHLIYKGANVNAQQKDGITPLHAAVFQENIQLVRLLLSKGAGVNVPEKECGSTPLHVAVVQENIQLAELLLNKDANINAQEKDGSTPLHLAAYGNLHQFVSLFLKRGAKADITDNKGQTPLDIAKANKFHELEKLFRPTEKSETNNVDELQKTIVQKTKEFFSKAKEALIRRPR